MCLAIPGLIIETGPEGEFRTGVVDFSGVKKDVSLALTPEAKVGDYVLVHAGVALNTVDEEEAHKTFEMLRQLDQLDEIR